MARLRTTRRIGAMVGALALSTGLITAGGIATAGASSAHHARAHRSSRDASSKATTATGTVLTVSASGTYDGSPSDYTSIQAAVDAAQPGDWILVAPGDYRETDDMSSSAWTSPGPSDHGGFGGVLITTPDIHIRGMNRNTTVVDGTTSGPECSSSPGDQNFGYVSGDKAAGRNGIVVYEADNVSIDNLTACNFLSGNAGGGNQVWWNGGADTEQIHLHGYEGSYLTATSTYFDGESTAAGYGIFSSDSAGISKLYPNGSSWTNIYASNQNDSGMYIGACRQVCAVTVSKAWMENSALGYSGTNSGGALVIKNSKFDNNQDGFDTNTQIAGDPPAPQNGACPNNGISPITHTHSCWVLEHNVFTNNNNPDVPAAGSAAAGPTGTGMTLSGGRNDTVMDNTFSNNKAWGFLLVPYPDSSTPEDHQSCSGTGGVEVTGFGCVYDPMNDRVANNTFKNNGGYNNPSNGDFGQIDLNGNQPSNCFVGNTDPSGKLVEGGEDLQGKYPTCGGNRVNPDTEGALLGNVLCDTGFGGCSKHSKYPKEPSAADISAIILSTLPGNTLNSTVTANLVANPSTAALPTMPNPCAGVPNDTSESWCVNGAVNS